MYYYLHIALNIHPFSSAYPKPGHGGKQLKQNSLISLSPAMSTSLFGRTPRRSQAAKRYNLSSASWGLLLVGHTQSSSPRRHLSQTPDLPQLAPFNVEE